MGGGSTGSSWRKELGKWFVLSGAITLVLVIFQFTIGGWPGPKQALVDFVLGFLFCWMISAACWLLIPIVAHRVWNRPLIRWAALLATMLVCAVFGTAAAIAILGVATRQPFRTLVTGFRENIQGTTTVTVVVGVLLVLFESTKSRLQTTELSLRTQQLERERAEKLAAEAQLASLSSRVQPHFLFNTLNSISALVRDDPAKAELMIERLSALLRSSLDGPDEVQVSQELKLVSDYLEIQQVRLGDRLRFEITTDPDARGRIPPFSLQTLVENSLRHVGSKRPEGVAVRVRARAAGPDLVLEVTDDGPGFDPDRMKAGHGLDTLAGRLRALYGERATLDFRRAPGAMTVEVRVPST